MSYLPDGPMEFSPEEVGFDRYDINDADVVFGVSCTEYGSGTSYTWPAEAGRGQYSVEWMNPIFDAASHAGGNLWYFEAFLRDRDYFAALMDSGDYTLTLPMGGELQEWQVDSFTDGINALVDFMGDSPIVVQSEPLAYRFATPDDFAELDDIDTSRSPVSLSYMYRVMAPPVARPRYWED